MKYVKTFENFAAAQDVKDVVKEIEPNKAEVKKEIEQVVQENPMAAKNQIAMLAKALGLSMEEMANPELVQNRLEKNPNLLNQINQSVEQKENMNVAGATAGLGVIGMIGSVVAGVAGAVAITPAAIALGISAALVGLGGLIAKKTKEDETSSSKPGYWQSGTSYNTGSFPEWWEN